MNTSELLFGDVVVGATPRVVGTLSTLGGFLRAAAAPAQLACDIVEVRLDLIDPDTPNWPARCEALSGAKPVLLTIRLAAEGGAWSGSEEERKALYVAGLRSVAALDVEGRSALAQPLVAEAQGLGRPVVLSYHDFEKTPSLTELQGMVALGEPWHGTLTKIATMVRNEQELDVLLDLLRAPRGRPLCLMGMGRFSDRTRREFPRLGSCLTYGYLDEPVAPGQPSAADLLRALS